MRYGVYTSHSYPDAIFTREQQAVEYCITRPKGSWRRLYKLEHPSVDYFKVPLQEILLGIEPRLIYGNSYN